MSNAPYNGGTHIPDVTVITPVFDESSYSENGDDACEEPNDPLFFVASRGHHSEIGGITPGSMPPFSRNIEEEGVLIHDFKLVSRGRLREREARALFGGCTAELSEKYGNKGGGGEGGEGPLDYDVEEETVPADARYPSRNVDQNLSDLRAQIAANQSGVREIHRLVSSYGLPQVEGYMQHVQDNAEEAVRRVIATLHNGEFEVEMDGDEDGTPSIRCKITVDHDRREAIVDFTGTAGQQPTNFNAPRAIVHAAVIYVFRTLVGDRIPLNAGCLKPLKIILPEGE